MQSTEAILEPALPIIDPHHHLWEGRGQPPSPYMLEELLGDIGSGHNIAATLYVECGSGYRPGGPEHLASVGETEFAKTAAERSSAAESSQTRICAGIVGFADLTRGAAVDEVLEAHLQVAPGRFRGIRNMSAWHEDAAVLSIASAPELLGDSRFRAGSGHPFPDCPVVGSVPTPPSPARLSPLGSTRARLKRAFGPHPEGADR